MLTDSQGLSLSRADRAGAAAYDHAIAGYLTYRADVPVRLEALLAAGADMPMAHVLKGYMMLLAFKQANVAAAKASLDQSRRAGEVTSREAAHIEALATWIDGDIDRTLRIWEEIVAAHPRDVLAFRLHHFLAFWTGAVDRMARMVDRVLPAFDADDPVRPALLACKAFAYEELGRYGEAETAGREALARNPADLWAAHAVAHILEMRGRGDEGISLLDTLEAHWGGGNSLLNHLWWHRGLFHFERGELTRVLELYDDRFRNMSLPYNQATPDLYIDVQNAASMLFRLERQGVDVGARWNELADKAETRIGDCLSPFTLPHWMMALVATRRNDQAEAMVAAMERFASQSRSSNAPVVKAYALPVCRALMARAAGRPGEALSVMRPALAGLDQLGGSHAQRDVLQQLYLDCALAAGARDDVDIVLAHVRRLYATPPEQMRGYRV